MKNYKESELKGFAIFKDEDHRKALYASLVFIMLMILFFLLVSLEQPNPPLKPEVMELVMEDFELEQGSQAAGGSNNQSEPENSTPTPTPRVEEAPRPTHTQREETTPTTSGSGTRPTTTTTTTTPQPDSDFSFPGGGSGGGGGNGTVFGNGDGVGGNGTGNTPGDGAYNPDRKVVAQARFDSNAQEEGTIALDLWVDANGNVIKTRFKEEKSTSGSQYLIGLAIKAAKTMKYDKKAGVASEHVGYATFVFVKS